MLIKKNVILNFTWKSNTIYTLHGVKNKHKYAY